MTFNLVFHNLLNNDCLREDSQLQRFLHTVTSPLQHTSQTTGLTFIPLRTNAKDGEVV